MNKSLATLTLVVTLAFAAAPLVSGDFAGFASDQLPVPQIDPPIQPAGYAFAIWGPIYLWLVASAIYGYLRKPNDAAWDRTRVPLCVSLGVGVPWLVIAQISAVWASVTIVVMLGGALVALDRATAARRWWLRAPVALYAGWLTAATFVSLGVTLAGYGILLDGYGWAIAGVIGALAVAIATYARTPSPIYLAAVIWALVAICVTNGTDNFVITSLALTGIAILLCVMAVWAPRST